jgi:hypothetical protein
MVGRVAQRRLTQLRHEPKHWPLLIGPAGSVLLMARHNLSSEEESMATMFVRHSVSDYKTWRKAYDEFASVQKAKGVTAQAVYQAADNPNDITVTHEFATVEAAQAFARSAELKNAMQNAGVTGAPTIWFTNRA